MKILVISTNADEAGAPRHVETIVMGLKNKFKFVVIFGEDGPVSQRLRNCGHVVYIVKEMRTAISPLKDLIALFKISRIVRHEKPEIIHCHSAKAGMLGRLCALLNEKSWIYTVHGWGWRGLPTLSKVLIIIIEKILSKFPKGYYIFVAKAVFRDGKDILGINKNRGAVLYNGVPKVKHSANSNHSQLKILMPARVSSAKDHQTMLASFERSNIINSELILCGSGTDNPDFISLAKEIAPISFSRISFLGQQSNMDEIYSGCNVVALISKFEALPLTIIEAMSCGKAIIATNVGGISELVTDGYNGILVGSGSEVEIVEAIRKYTNEFVRLEFGNNARATYEKEFTEQRMLEGVSRIYKSRGG